MIRRRLCIALAAALVFVLAACGGGGSSSGPVEIAVWHGYQDSEGKVFKDLIDQYNKEHPDVRVTELYSSNDLVLQKVLTAVRGGSAPDVAYMFGSWSPNIANIPQVVDMAGEVSAPGWKWDDFYPAERAAATVGDKIVGVPALVDNLAIVYNKKLFADAGVAPPTPSWTWDDFRAAAAKLTDPSKGQYGWLIPADGSEDTAWHYIPMLWEAGGEILSPDNEHAVFNSEAGAKALAVLEQMAVTDKSLYLDTTNENGPKLMNSGKVAMLITGPWDLSSLSDIDYGVQVMPTFAGSAGAHQTISGPDNWVVFNNGDRKKRAAIDFVKWLTAPEQVTAFSLGTGDLPTRISVGQDQALVAKLDENLPGTATFVQNLSNVKAIRPTVEQYPDISEALGQAIVSVMLGKDRPAAALNTAAQAADAALAGK
ncbi:MULTISPECIES: ABC transporter substrate-binding protein [unclassified Mycolicibacterium]|uniref:ABC transporter substrate-binding protein n=1 Tax=unclassified Mycolicibacterium TaxID=2636767 RepID=UPI00130C6F8A|nr:MULTISPECIES: ABC transporter substrate-binding protein [unclassified Mycolicibacterium]MUL83022.1 ABC transporter substrate-binding protein [Mycolicibacterium sp. CBMA 329]MUL89357.1 ABC transporter substrate-binding protein [Mycolicibacterium sp. CBMA 331]MUL99046.1 ABC transporter substrate-binding protein [Mycolicibacterium sp. CBMA 334]MUM30174.1 ABC transporter substrate-binding protein [Mycolicibacterium sp. CBMA 295]MUM38873.1 ABC transporter substrate-binding protein [Mycolicibacte